jgi:ribosomal protein L7/L12
MNLMAGIGAIAFAVLLFAMLLHRNIQRRRSAADPYAALKPAQATQGVESSAAVHAADFGSGQAVVLVDCGARKLEVIQQVRKICPKISLLGAKNLIESTPCTVRANLGAEEANVIRQRLEAVGATVKVV